MELILQYSGSESDDSDRSTEREEEGAESLSPSVQKGRKRIRHETKAEQRKRQRNSGEDYVNIRGDLVKGKQFTNATCRCRLECSVQIPQDNRKAIFEEFWGMGSSAQQNTFLCGLVEQSFPARRRVKQPSGSQKTVTNRYTLQSGGERVDVCKTFFLQTFQISNGRMTRALKKFRTGDVGACAHKRSAPTNKTPDEMLDNVRHHIAKFPSYESHYTRSQNPNRRYLPPNLNVRLMYNLYTEWCDENEVPKVKEGKYRFIFNNEFNLHFHAPIKDSCAKCDNFKATKSTLQSDEEKKRVEDEHNVHLEKAEDARRSMRSDASKSKQDTSFYAFTFDLEKALPFPILSTSVAYYKRNMYVYNLGCHDLGTGRGYMYAWEEIEASRGAQEISSCVVKHITSHANMAKQIAMYSDSCTGQNRNLKFTLAILRLVSKDDNQIEAIDHKFMVSGHSYLPNDTDFASVENCSKKRTIYVPEDWYQVIKDARKNNPFTLTKMTQKDFTSTENLERSVTKRKKNTGNTQASWLKMQWIRVQKSHPYSIFYKESLSESEPFCELDIKSTRRGRPSSLADIPLKPLYEIARPVSTEKRKDMLALLPYIPPMHHKFFLDLNVEDSAADDGPLECIDEVE